MENGTYLVNALADCDGGGLRVVAGPVVNVEEAAVSHLMAAPECDTLYILFIGPEHQPYGAAFVKISPAYMVHLKQKARQSL